MHTLILAQRFNTHTTRRLSTVLKARGHRLSIVRPMACAVRVDGIGSDLFHRGERLPRADIALLRCSAYSRFGQTVVRTFETAVAHHLQMNGVLCVNDPEAKRRAHNKLRSLQLLHEAGIAVPATFLVWDSADLDRILQEHLGTPLILKTLQGTRGLGVMRVESPESARSVFEAMTSAGQMVMAQAYVAEAGDADIRVTVVDGVVMAAWRRLAPPGEFRSNMHRGASTEPVQLNPEQEEVALAAAQALGLDVAGVDLLEAASGPVVLEVNPSPGLRLDAVKRLVDCLEQRVGEGK